MGNIVLSLLITLIIAANVSGLDPSYAQGLNDSYSPLDPGTNTTIPQASTEEFDWRWVLPLLAIPFVFLFLPKKREEQYVGTKGGRASKRKRIHKEEKMHERSYLKKK